MKKTIAAVVVLLVVCVAGAAYFAVSGGNAGEAAYIPGETAPDAGTAKFEWAFVEPPHVGDVILKVRRVPELDDVRVFAEYDMPSMRGHHASGKVEFRRNKAGDYVLPIRFAMRGDWEIVLTFEHDGEEFRREVLREDV